MILELAKCTAALAAVFLSGGVVYLMIIAKEDRRWLEAISYGWGAGIVLLYVVGGLMIRIPPLFFNWHMCYLGFVFLLVAVPVLFRVRRCGLSGLQLHRVLPRVALSAPRFDLWAALMLAFLAFHALLLLWIGLNRPVFDSDAISPQRWVGLAKTVYRLGGLPVSTHVWNPTFPSLIPLWPNMFTARWYDSLAAIPWFIFYVLILLTAARFVCRITGNLRAGLAYACVLASSPLLWVHAIRPGFSDLIVCYFMAAVMTLLFSSYQYQQRRYFLFSLLFMIGACMSKQEAVAWMFLIYGSYGLLYWHVRYRKPAANVLLIEGITVAVSFVAYLLTLDQMHRLVIGRFTYLGLLFRFRYDPSALRLLIERTFTWATFGIYWYFVFGILIYLLVRSRDPFVRLVCVQSLWISALVCYYLCGTGNVKLTIAGTNASRLLLHWVPAGGVLFAMLVSQVLRQKAASDRTRVRSGVA